jgi:hypothetical protein
MSNITFHLLTDAQAEETLAEIWTSLERFRLPSPALTLVSDGNDGRSKIRIEFAEERNAMLKVQRSLRPTVALGVSKRCPDTKLVRMRG